MQVAALQLDINDEETKLARTLRVEGILDGLRGTDLILLPEIWNIGYFSFDRYREESETLTGETISRLAAKAKDLNSYIYTGSFVERERDKYFNTAVLLNKKGEISCIYRKIHLFGYGSEERRLLSPGDQITVADSEFGKIGLSICYDLRFPEVFRRMVDRGVEIILICAAWPYPRLEHWLLLNRVRAIENQCYLIACCCAGSNRGKPFIGHSQVIDPWGIVVAGAGDRGTILRAEIDPNIVAGTREEFSFLKDRVLTL